VEAVSKAREERATVLDLMPTGLWFGGLLALARTWVLGAAPPGSAAEAIALQRWATVQVFPNILAEALVAGVAGGFLLVIAANRGQWALRVIGFVLAVAVATIFLAGIPGMGGSAPVPGFGRDVAILASGSALVALMFAHTGNLVRGKLALATALLCAVVLPVLAARLLASDAPTMQRRIVIADIVASQDSWRIIEQRPGLPPKPVTLTPIVDAHADVADKSAIRMSPPCAVGFDVPVEAGSCVLRAAAGADLSVVERLPNGLLSLTIDYTVEVDGVVDGE